MISTEHELMSCTRKGSVEAKATQAPNEKNALTWDPTAHELVPRLD